MEYNGSDYTKITMEETTYWNYFQTVRFSVQLSKDFETQLIIPKRFTEKIRKKLPEKVFLKGPSVESHSWEVLLSTSNNTTSIIGEGWKEFVTAYNLKENDFLVFKYKNNTCFKVSMFDAQNCGVEKESSYFVKKCIVPKSSDHNENRQEKMDNSRKETSLHDKISRVIRRPRSREPLVWPRSATNARRESVSQQSKESCSLLKDTYSLKQETISEVEKITNNDQSSISRGSRERKVLFEDSESDDDKPFFSRSLPLFKAVKMKTEPEVEYVSYPRNSCNREQKAREIQRARQRAKELQMHREKSFFVALSRSHVYGTMKLGIPKHWWNEVVKSQYDKCLKLRVKGKDEYDPHLYVCYYDKFNCTGTITTGWRKFVQENSLYEHDCCVFSLAKPLEDNYEFIYLEVEIIRAINS